MTAIMTILAVVVAILSCVFTLAVGTVAGAVFYFNQVVPFFNRHFRRGIFARFWR